MKLSKRTILKLALIPLLIIGFVGIFYAIKYSLSQPKLINQNQIEQKTTNNNSSVNQTIESQSLGEVVFNIKLNKGVSCSSCHDPNHYFVDNKPTSQGVHGDIGTRNAPSLLNIIYQKDFFWDGREKNLKKAVLQPFINNYEMGYPDIESVLFEINQKLSTKIDKPLSKNDLSNALVDYIKDLKRPPTKYQLFLENKTKLSQDELNGMELFNKNCASCHPSDKHFTDQKYHEDILNGKIQSITKGIETLENYKQSENLSNLIISNPNVASIGAYVQNRDITKIAFFRTPSLDYVSHTYPYYHDGHIINLQQVVMLENYYRTPDKTKLSMDEIVEIVDFLKTL